MRVYLRSENDRPRVSFRHEDLDRAMAERPPHHGVRGWFERKAAHYKTTWHHSGSAVVRGARGVWDWLQRQTYSDEPLLAHLRLLPSVEVAHAPSLGEDDAAKLWENYLTARQRRHAAWFAVNVLVSPLTVLLAPLPGPNLIGYWFAYRAFHHGLILAGVRKAKAGRVPATFHEAEAADLCRADDAPARAAACRGEDPAYGSPP